MLSSLVNNPLAATKFTKLQANLEHKATSEGVHYEHTTLAICHSEMFNCCLHKAFEVLHR